MKTPAVVTWKTTTWLAFNLGAQALPIFFLWRLGSEEPKAFWEYVNCTLVSLISIGMLFAAISDLITERGRIDATGWGTLIVIVLISLVNLHRTIHDEFLKAAKPDLDLLISSVVFSLAVVVVGSFLKAKMWYDEDKRRP